MWTDEQLMEQLQQGQTRALDALYQRYAKRLYAFCYHSTRTHPQDVEDLVQDVFLRVIRGADSYNPRKASFRTWLFRIARNRCIDVVRRSQVVQFTPLTRRATQDEDDEALAPQADIIDREQGDPESAVIGMSTIEAVRNCLAELTDPAEKQAILLYYLGGKVYREIGEMLGESTSTARNRVQSAQQKVKRCLERKGIHSTL